MRRRDTIALAGAAAIVRPPSVRAQRAALPMIGFLSITSPEESAATQAAFLNGLKAAGYVGGGNVGIEYRWAQGRLELLPALASELVALGVTVIVAPSLSAALAAHKTTRAIPIVFMASRPIERGLAASYSRPGGNATGVDPFVPDLIPKRLELLRDLMPKARSVAYFLNPEAGGGAVYERAQVEAAARATGHDVQLVEARTESEIELAFARFAAHRPDAIVAGVDPFFYVRRHQMIALAARHAIPTIYEFPNQAVAGGLISLGPSLTEANRIIGGYAGKILAGARPSDLPIQRLTKTELVINLKTAKALGLAVPTALLDRADEVIE
jgi:putative ABC transport system substrate-binding protein